MILSLENTVVGERIATEKKTIPMSNSTYERLQEELDQLLSKLSETMISQGEAGSASDWHDNAAYDEAVRASGVLQTQVERIREVLSAAEIIEPRQETAQVGIGNTIEVLFDGEDDPETYTILGPEDSATRQDMISVVSPLGKSVLGKKAGETVSYRVGSRDISVKVLTVLPGNF